MSHKVMGKAGHFGKTLTMLARTVRLSTSTIDCDTKHLVKYHVNDAKFLKKLNGKFYTLVKDDIKSLKPLKYEKCKDLIGKDIYVRSAATCALKNEICPKCFGLTANLNFDIADGIGSFQSEEITKVIEQNILSTKHLLTTSSEEIKFNPEFDRFFQITSDEINPIITNSDIEDLNNWVIRIDESNIGKVEEMDSDEGFNTYIKNGKFEVVNLKTGEFFEMYELNGKEIYLTDEFLELRRKSKGVVRFKDLDDDSVLFTIIILNNELTKPLYEIIDLINSDKSDKTPEINRTINEVSQRFIELMVESKIDAQAVGAEIIINRLIRCEDDIFERPDFSQTILPKYRIVTIAKALEKHRSPLVGLSYQFLKRQLFNDDTIDEKWEPSYLDPFFKEEIPTHKQKAHIKYVKDEKRKRLEKMRPKK